MAIGPPGLGKTHLSVAIGVQQVLKGFDVRFVRVQTLMNRLLEGNARDREQALKPLRKCGVLVLDELGYLLPGKCQAV